MGELKRLDRKSIDKNRIDIARLLGIPSGGIIVSENGRVEIHNIPEDDARRYSNILRNKVKDIRLIPGKYDFRKVPLPGQVPGRLVTISGMLKDNLTEEVLNEVKEFRDYKGYEMRADYDVDPEEGIMSLVVHLYKDGKEVQQDEYGRELSFENYRKAREWIDKNAKPCTVLEKANQLKDLIDCSQGGEVIRILSGIILIEEDKYAPTFEEWHRWYLDDEFRYSILLYNRISPYAYDDDENYTSEEKEWISAHLRLEVKDAKQDERRVSPLILKHLLIHPFDNTPFNWTGKGLSNFIDAVDKAFGLLGVNGISEEDIAVLKDAYDCSTPWNEEDDLDESLIEAKKKKKKKRLGGTLNPDAGNVEHNINMFNHMNSPIGGPSNNPVSGPFGGDVSAPSIGGCCEAFEKSKEELIEGMRLTNGMREDEHYYFDDGNYSYHFFSKQDLYGITNQFAILVVDYGFEFHYDKMYRDEKSNMDVIPTTMRHERPKKICYFEFDEDTQPDIVDAFLDDDMNAFRNAVKAATEKEVNAHKIDSGVNDDLQNALMEKWSRRPSDSAIKQLSNRYREHNKVHPIIFCNGDVSYIDRYNNHSIHILGYIPVECYFVTEFNHVDEHGKKDDIYFHYSDGGYEAIGPMSNSAAKNEVMAFAKDLSNPVAVAHAMQLICIEYDADTDRFDGITECGDLDFVYVIEYIYTNGLNPDQESKLLDTFTKSEILNTYKKFVQSVTYMKESISSHSKSNNHLNETKLEESTTKTVYRAEYYEPKLGKWISYYENSDVEKVKSNKEAPIIGNPKIRVAEYEVSGVRKPSYKFVSLVENVDHKENYYMAKYRGVNTDRLHKVYFSCDGNFEDAENLLDELIAEPYTDARVLGTVSPAAAERDGFTKIGGTSNKELDDDFNMSTRTLW